MRIAGSTRWVAPLAEALRARGWTIATAESCTGGLIAAACTALAGSSDWFERGFVTYSDGAKTEQLGVDAATIATHGAVSEAVVRSMADGALAGGRSILVPRLPAAANTVTPCWVRS